MKWNKHVWTSELWATHLHCFVVICIGLLTQSFPTLFMVSVTQQGEIMQLLFICVLPQPVKDCHANYWLPKPESHLLYNSLPRLELLSALILAKLITNVINVPQNKIFITETVCWTDLRWHYSGLQVQRKSGNSLYKTACK